MSNLIIGVVSSFVGIILIAFKLKNDENSSLKAQLFKLQSNAQLQPLNEQLIEVQKEIEDAKKAYDTITTSSASSES